ncbi:MAG: hypothetical protein ACM3ZO_11930, partial [Clostridia bacterium]
RTSEGGAKDGGGGGTSLGSSPAGGPDANGEQDGGGQDRPASGERVAAAPGGVAHRARVAPPAAPLVAFEEVPWPDVEEPATAEPGETVGKANTVPTGGTGKAAARHFAPGAAPASAAGAASSASIESGAGDSENGNGSADGNGNGNGNGDATDTSGGEDGEFAESLARARAAIMDHPAVKAAISVFGGRVFKIEI